MCRFLLVKSKIPIKPEKLLTRFSLASQKSKTIEGDWQGDGWGVAWLADRHSWQTYKSLKPVWKDSDRFKGFPQTSIFIAHARSATFPAQKNNIGFNQPFITGKYAFVFNGFLKGVTLPNIPGEIGAQKIWYLLSQRLLTQSPESAFKKLKEELLKNSEQVVALNIGLATLEDIYSLNYFTQHPEYYRIYKRNNLDITTVCSEKIDID